MANTANALFCERCGSKTMLYELMENAGYDEETMRETAIANDLSEKEQPGKVENEIRFVEGDIPF